MDYFLRNDQVELRVSSLGAEIQSFKDQEGLEYIWQGDPAYWSGRAPHLFPICGSLRENQAFYQEKLLKMPRHGLVRKKEFQVLEADESRLIFSIKPDSDMLEAYPFYFELRVVYRLQGTTCSLTYQIYNQDQEPLPFFIGGHPAFICPLLADEDFSDYELDFCKNLDLSYPTCLPSGLIDRKKRSPLPLENGRLSLSYQLFDQDSLIFENLESKKVTLRSKKSGHGLEVSFKDFAHLILWTSANQGPFLAIEPWSGLSMDTEESDNFAERKGLAFVQPGQMKSYAYDIKIIEKEV